MRGQEAIRPSSSGQGANISLTSLPRGPWETKGSAEFDPEGENEALPFLSSDMHEDCQRKSSSAWARFQPSKTGALGLDNIHAEPLPPVQSLSSLLPSPPQPAVAISFITGLVVASLLIVSIARFPSRTTRVYRGPDSVQQADLTFFIIGDWGRDGNVSQLLAAQMMTDVGTTHPPSFIISTGDNFYCNGLSGPRDTKYQKSFTDVYSSESLNVPWYLILGNHDYGDGYDGNLSECSHLPGSYDLAGCSECCVSPLWQLPEYNGANLDSRWNTQQGAWSKKFLNGRLHIVFIDTSPFISEYYTQDMANVSGGVATQDTEGQKKVVENLLSDAESAQWRLVVGHHPVYSYGHHCITSTQCEEMQWLRPVLQKYRVSAYISGHEHDLQLIQPAGDPVAYVVSGAGSDVREDDFTHKIDTTGLDTSYFAADQGFVVATVKGSTLSLFIYRSNSETPVKSITLPMWS